MGGSNHNDDVYRARMAMHKSAGTSAFVHDANIKSGAVPHVVHAKVDAKKVNTVGKLIRESFDSDAHPESVPIAILFDTTGSMDRAPRIFVERLGALMAALVKKGYVPHPHVLFGAIGDATCNDFPIQIGQFEAGNEMDDALTALVLEGGGGGHITESYELTAYFMARHTDLDSVKKRGKKGYLFFIGDELPYQVVNRTQVEKFIGDKLEANIRFSASDPRNNADDKTEGDILEELREKFEVFWVMPGGTDHWNDKRVNDPLKTMFGQNYLRLPDAADVCELLVTTIGVCEGFDIDTIATDLKSVGATAKAVDMATSALTTYAGSRGLVKKATTTGDLVVAGSDAVERL